ncbi:TolC family protein [Gemmatimonadota bacterium]
MIAGNRRSTGADYVGSEPVGRGSGSIICLLVATLVLSVSTAATRAQTERAAGTRNMTLEESILIALEDSRSVQDARFALEVARKQVVEARGLAMPTVAASANFTRSLTPLESFLPAIIFDPTASPDDFIAVRFGADNNWFSSLTLDQTLFDYTVFIGLRVASTFRELSEEALRGTAQQAATATRKAFYAALLARESLRLTENSVSRLRQTLEETTALQEAGLASDYDVLRLEVELANFEPRLRQASDALEAARRNLALVMGYDVDEPFDPAGSLMEIDIETGEASTDASRSLLRVVGEPDAIALGFDRILERSLNDRTDLRQTRINLDLGRAQVQASRSNYYPTLAGFYSYSVTAQENGAPNFFGESSRNRTSLQQAGLRLQVPLFAGFQKSSRVQQNMLSVDRISTRLAQLREQTFSEVRTLLDALEETRQRTLAQARAVGQARTGFGIATARYREGVSSRLEVVDAENALRQAEFNYAQAVFDYLNTQADLDLAIGSVPLVDDIEP